MLTYPVGDAQIWCGITSAINGVLAALQDTLGIVRELVYPQQGVPRPDYNRTFTLWCRAAECFVRGVENWLQLFFDSFIPIQFTFNRFFCMVDSALCVAIKSVGLFVKIIVNYREAIIGFFTGTFWRTEVKRDYIEIINLIGEPTEFAPISVPVPGQTSPMTITHYRLNTTDQATPEGLFNPVFGKQRLGECVGQFWQRLFCDPLNTGTACSVTWADTLFERVDFGCSSRYIFAMVANADAYAFETLLHMNGANEFLIYLDKQPFTTHLKENGVDLAECLSQALWVVEDYGYCLARVFSESWRLMACTVELYYRIVVALLTLPYYQAFMPGTCNFISCPDRAALTMAISFYERLVEETPDSLVNCMCYLLNSAFALPYAGCPMNTCVATNFVPPPPVPPAGARRVVLKKQNCS